MSSSWAPAPPYRPRHARPPRLRLLAAIVAAGALVLAVELWRAAR